MFSAIKRLGRDNRGNTLVIAAAALPLIMGAAGLATDTIQWVTWKRELQRAADSAAFSGVYASAQGAAVDEAVESAATRFNTTKVSLKTGFPQVAYPTSAGWTNAVQVTLAVQKKLTFASFFLSTPPTITATATAALTDDGDYCVVALDDSSASGVTIGGSANANLGCGVISNSISANASVGTNGNAYNLAASPVAAVGGMPSSIRGASDLKPYHVAMPDPYAGKYSTDIPTGKTCRGNINASGARDGAGNVNPGCYNNFNPGNGTTNLNSGIYYLNNTGLSINGNTAIRGSGVVIIFTGTNPGSLSMNGNSVINISAPTSSDCGTFDGVDTCNFKNMLMIQSDAATAGNSNKINGNNGAKLDGAIYFPRGTLNFTGNSSPATKCAMIVAYRVDFGGNTDIQNNTTGCTANSTVSGKVVRLVA